jgi:hypothetical protein
MRDDHEAYITLISVKNGLYLFANSAAAQITYNQKGGTQHKQIKHTRVQVIIYKK